MGRMDRDGSQRLIKHASQFTHPHRCVTGGTGGSSQVKS